MRLEEDIIKKYRELSGDENTIITPISRIIGYLDGYEKALEQETCEDEYIQVPKKALKYRTAGMVAYNVEWLKNHFDTERAIICGVQETKTGRWIYGRDNLGTGRNGWYCNQCEHFEFWDHSLDMKSAKLNLPNLCPNCGAKMEDK